MTEEGPEARAQAVRHGLDRLREGKVREACAELAALADEAWEATPEARRLRALALDGLGRARFALGDAAGGIAALREAAEILGGEAPLLALRCHVLQNLCFALSETGATAESAAAGEEAVRLAETLYGPRSPELAGALFRLSAAPYRARDFASAEALILRAKAIWEAQEGPLPEQVGTCLNNLGRIHEELGDMAGGIAFHREAVAFRRTLPDREDLAFSLGNLGVALGKDGQWPAACAALEEAVEIYGAIGKGGSREAKGYAANLDICRAALAEEQNLL